MDEPEYWFQKNNFMAKFMSDKDRAICKKIVEKHKRLAEEAKKPKPRGRKKK